MRPGQSRSESESETGTESGGRKSASSACTIKPRVCFFIFFVFMCVCVLSFFLFFFFLFSIFLVKMQSMEFGNQARLNYRTIFVCEKMTDDGIFYYHILCESYKLMDTPIFIPSFVYTKRNFAFMSIFRKKKKGEIFVKTIVYFYISFLPSLFL